MDSSHQPRIPLPPVDGTLTFPEALAFQSQYNPTEPIYMFSPDGNAEEPTKVTFQEFGRACDRAAHLIRPKPSILPDAHVVGIILVTDILQFQITLIGVMRAGLVPFPISPHLSPDVIVHTLRSTSIHDLIVTSATLPPNFLLGIKEEINRHDCDYDLRIQEMPSMSSVLMKSTPDYTTDLSDFHPLPATAPSPDELALYLNSSGSTGTPKPIPLTHKMLCQWASLGDPELRTHNSRLRMFGAGLPPFHAIGFYVFGLIPIYHGIPIPILPPVDTATGVFPPAPSPSLILEHANRNKATALVAVPVFLQVWAHSKDDVSFLAGLEYVCFFGGPISTTIGDDLVSAGVNLQSMLGTTETGPICKYHIQRGHESNWAWFEMSDKISIEWIDQGDGTYECHCLIGELHEPAVVNRSDKKGLALSDLFIKHPTEDNLWKIVGRVDDVITHSSGMKTLPSPIEEIVASSPLVQGVVVFGHGHVNTGILVEVYAEFTVDTEDSARLKQLRDRLWPYIEAANKAAPKHSRIFKEMILVARPDKPLPRVAKSTVTRKLALQEYSSEIESLYKEFVSESSTRSNEVEPPTSWDAASLEGWLDDQLSQMLGAETLNSSKDLFEQGCDSLAATFLQFRIADSLKTVSPSPSYAILQTIVYNHPTIEGLAHYLSRIVTDSSRPGENEHRRNIDAMIAQYSAGLSSVRLPSAGVSSAGPSSVLLTGSTGHLGSHILASLVENPTVHRVYTFNRTGIRSVEERHFERFQDAGLNVNVLESSKIRFAKGDLSVKNFGLSDELYREIQQSVTLIIHTSWELNFNLTLASFESHISGVRNLINLAREGPHASSLRFVFTSSVSAAQSWDTAQGLYPEAVVRESKYSIGMGYGESKYVAERILEHSGLNACSVRIGQLSGTTKTGTWAMSDWLPILVKSSIALGGLPSAPGLVSWLPIDYAAQVILDLAFTKDHLPLAINLVHPQPVPWNRIIEAVQNGLVDAIGLDIAKIPVIPFPLWVDHLYSKFKDAAPQDMANIPALKLIDFFRVMSEAEQLLQIPGSDAVEFGGVPVLSIKKAKELSPSLQIVYPLQASEIRLWVEYWKSKGFLF